jgi:hypothetical protein
VRLTIYKVYLRAVNVGWKDAAKRISKKLAQGAEKYNVVKDSEGGFEGIKTAASHADVHMQTPDMLEDVAKGYGDSVSNPYYISELQAKHGLGRKTLRQAEFEAQKNGADSVYLSADASIPPEYGQKNLTQKELEDFYSSEGYKMAAEPEYRDGKLWSAPTFLKNLEDSPALSENIVAKSKRAAKSGFDVNAKGEIVHGTTGEIRHPAARFDPNKVGSFNKFAGAAAIPAAGALTPENVAAFRSNLGQKAKDIGSSMVDAYNKAQSYADKSKADMNERSAQLPFAAAGIKPTEAQLADSRERATERNQIAEDAGGNFGAMADGSKKVAATTFEMLKAAADKKAALTKLSKEADRGFMSTKQNSDLWKTLTGQTLPVDEIKSLGSVRVIDTAVKPANFIKEVIPPATTKAAEIADKMVPKAEAPVAPKKIKGYSSGIL